MKRYFFVYVSLIFLFSLFSCTTECMTNQNIPAEQESKSYKLTFHCEGITLKDGYTFPTKYNNAQDFILPTSEAFVLPDGFHVVWNDRADLQGNVYTKIEKGSKGDKEFWAVLYTNNYNITYHYDGLTLKNGMQLQPYYNEAYELTLPTDDYFALEIGYHIAWYDNADLTGDIITKIDKGCIGHKDFWIKKYTNTYNLTLHCKGIDVSDDYVLPTSYTECDGMNLPSRNKFDIDINDNIIWYNNPDLIGDIITKIEKGSTGDKEFWAKKYKYGYNLTFHCNGIILKDDYRLPTNYIIEYGIKLPPDDYFLLTENAHVYWFDNEDLSGDAITRVDAGSIGDKEFWAEVRVPVTELDSYMSNLDTGNNPYSIAIADNSPDLLDISQILKSYKTINVNLNLKYCSGLTSIGESAFMNCSSLQSITIPDKVTNIGNYAFSGCKLLQNITLGSNLQSIGEYAFQMCTRLQSITIPDKVTNIGNSAFFACTFLQNITLGSNLQSIGESAFQTCISLQSITIPNKVTNIEKHAFIYCSNLNSVTIKATTPPALDSTAFEMCNNLSSIYVPVGYYYAYMEADGWKDYADKIGF